jgi:hypothetical protein
MGARDFGWSTLALEMLEPDEGGARSSYLGPSPPGHDSATSAGR